MGDQLRRLAFWVGCIAFVAALVWIAVSAPQTVPAHIGADGEVTRWESRTQFLTTAALVGTGMVALFIGSKWLISRASPQLINLPNARAHAYWTSAENRPEFNRRINADLDLFCGATLLLLAVMFTSVVGSGDTRGAVSALPTVGVYLALVIGYCLYMTFGARYKVPKEVSSGDE